MPGSFHTRNVAQISNREISTGQNQLMLQNQIRGRSRSWNGCMNTHDQKPLPAVWEYRSWSATIAPFCVEVMRQEVSCFPSLLGHLTGTAPPATPTTEDRPVFLSPKVKTSSSHFSLVSRSLLHECVSPTGGDCRRSPCHRPARPGGRAAAGRSPRSSLPCRAAHRVTRLATVGEPLVAAGGPPGCGGAVAPASPAGQAGIWATGLGWTLATGHWPAGDTRQ